MSIRIAVIGAGLMGTDHARIIAGDLLGATLQVVCDASVDRARMIADELGALHVATDPVATIARADVDAVIIASPDPTHAPLVRACIAAGKPVLCEKPLAQSSAQTLTQAICSGWGPIPLWLPRHLDRRSITSMPKTRF